MTIKTPQTTYAIQCKYKDEDWRWSLYYDKPFDSKDEANQALKKSRRSKNDAWEHRLVAITIDPVWSYFSEIEMLHGKAIAQSNPWLWVYQFKLCLLIP